MLCTVPVDNLIRRYARPLGRRPYCQSSHRSAVL